jgi:predicted GIY-YIG superfamily endonuclease
MYFIMYFQVVDLMKTQISSVCSDVDQKINQEEKLKEDSRNWKERNFRGKN